MGGKEEVEGELQQESQKVQKGQLDSGTPGNNGACRSFQSHAMCDVCKRMRGSVRVCKRVTVCVNVCVRARAEERALASRGHKVM